MKLLSKRQSTALSRIVQAFDDGDAIVHLHGPAGGGKSTLIKEYVDNVTSNFEDWSVYYIEGKKHTVEAYATIKLAEGINQPTHELSGFNLSLGFKIPELFTLGVAGVFQKKPQFDPKVNFVYKELHRNSSSNILIVADSFQYWDSSSKEFLMTLNNSRKKLLSHKNLKILLVTDDDVTQASDYIDIKTLCSEGEGKGQEITFSLPVKTDLREAIHRLGYTDLKLQDDDLDGILSITGGHLDFIKLFIEGFYYSRQGKLSTETSLFDVMKFLEYRLERFGDKKKEFSQVLEVSSIFNGDFKVEQIKYLLKDITDLDDLLIESCTNEFLKESNHFIFANVFIQDLFYKRLKQNGRGFRFEVEYADYLKEQEPENYIGRAYYLSSGDRHHERGLEIIELFTLAYCRNIESSTGDAESRRIESLIKETFDSNKDNYEVRTQYNNFLYLKTAYELYYQEQYEEANNELNRTLDSGPVLIMSEIKRMRLVIALMLNLDTENVRRLVEQLHALLEELKQQEKEQWCKSAFTLFSTYSNKLDDFEMSASIVQELRAFIRKNCNNGLFVYMGKIISRKACVYENAALSIQHTKDAMEYFEGRNDYLQYYLALCNYSGNLLVVGDYDKSIYHLNRCLQLVVDSPTIQFPSQEKVHNNLFLATFLKKYRAMNILDESIQIAIDGFEAKISDIPRESSAILYINLINLYVMKGEYHKSYNMLEVLQNKILKDNDDSFYHYHISNIRLALSIVQQSWDEAEKFLVDLNNNFPNFHKKNKINIQKRNQALSSLVNNKISLQADQLDKWVYDNAQSLDAAGGFYCRLFLFSDLQFTSI